MTTEYIHYALTAKTPNIACHGTSFPALEAVHKYIVELQELGLCTSYVILGLKDGKWHLVEETTNNPLAVWIHHSDSTHSNFDYSVTDWKAAQESIAGIIEEEFGFVVDEKHRAAIIELLAGDRWPEAVILFNKHNAMKAHILVREGHGVFDQPYPPENHERTAGYDAESFIGAATN